VLLEKISSELDGLREEQFIVIDLSSMAY
jgi:hypothetical protein